MEFIQVVNNLSEKVDKTLASFLDKKIATAPFSYHRTYYLNIKEFILRGGKRLRPISLIQAYRGVADSDGKIFLPSISVEFLHNATLIHDDLIDHDELRRNGPTFHVNYREWYKKEISLKDKAEDFGNTMAILAGNTTYNLGIETLLSSKFNYDLICKAIELYQKVFQELINGVMFESVIQTRDNATMEDYLQMVKMKTSSLLEKSIQMGAVLARATPNQIKALSEYAVLVGQAFQIQDDILGTFGTESETGKPTDGDIKEGKRTVLVIQAFDNASINELNILKKVLGDSRADASKVEKVRRIFQETGALENSKKIALELEERAKKKLLKADPPLKKEAHQFFNNLADFVVSRIY
ncbi:MAG: polyprenyl synthetase family protein [Candidatus Jordarchaeum sp.]|uniref:polyprenyl synthetase family protein n=1 Tax=Candidatus Jordarchaeum sp. TaxID=2823881 RepID=UPI0040497EC4